MESYYKNGISNITYYLHESISLIITSMLCLRNKSEYDQSLVEMPADIIAALNHIKNGIIPDGAIFTTYGGNHTYNTIPEELDSETYAFVFNVVCNEDTGVVVMTHQSESTYYLWVNDSYIGKSKYEDKIQLHLNKGDNYFCFVMSKLVSPLKLFIRVSKRTSEMRNLYTPAVGPNNYTDANGEISLLDVDYHWNERSIYRGILYSFNHVEIDMMQNVSVTVRNYYSSQVYYKRYIKFNEPFEIDMNCVPHFIDSRLNFFLIHFEYLYSDGRVRYIDKFFSFEPVSVSRDKIYNEAMDIINDTSILDTTRNLIQFRIEDLSLYEDDSYLIAAKLEASKREICQVHSDEIPKYEYHSRLNFLYYRSKLDNQLVRYAVYLPDDYDKSKSYPLIINHAYSQWQNPTSTLNLYNYRSKVIIANIPARGVTVGNYIAEATLNEVLEEIGKRFYFDKTRVSAIGYSSGGAAAWVQAELTPDRFAAIEPCAGYFIPELIGNLSNMAVLDVESSTDEDHWSAIQNNINEFKNNKKYQLLEAENMVHTLVGRVYVNGNIIDKLSEYQIDMYPNEVYYRAINNRHLKAYWITIHSIEDTAEISDIQANIISSDTIEIQCNNITGFTIVIPPQITGDVISVVVNNTPMWFDRKTNDRISIVKKYDGTYDFGEKDVQSFKIYHGLGLLDVYLKPVRIINMNPDSAVMIKSADKFSSPKTNTYDPKIYVSYPIYTPETIDTVELENSSIIVLDSNCSNQLSEYLKTHCEIKMDDTGFEYNGIRYEGDYCVMQIMKHPCNSECTILYVNANNDRLYSRNFFTREVTIPMYGKRHPYYGNAALVYYQRKYYSIFEYGCTMSEI